MKSSVRFGAGALLAALLGLQAPQAQATFVVDVTQSGPNVVMTGSGTLDLTGLSLVGPHTGGTGVLPSLGEIGIGAAAGPQTAYSGITGPGNFGSGAGILSSSGTGDHVSLFDDLNSMLVPTGYVSGASLSDSATFDNATIAGLGMTPGTYTWTWDTAAGVPVDSFVLNIGNVSVPEPLTLSLFGAGLLGAASMRRRKFRIAV